MLWAESFDLPADDLPLVSSAVVGRVQSAFPELARRSDAPALGIDGEDYATFLRLHRAFREQSLPVAELLGGLAALRTRAPDFPEVYRLEAKVVYDAYFYSRNPADLERAFDLLHRADRLAPGHAEVLHEMFRVALDSGEVELARDTLHRLETLEPGAARVRAQSALLLEHEGRPAEALAQLRASVRQHPSWRGLYELASMESRLGQVDAARQSLEELLQRVPGHYNASSFLAQLELFHGALARAEELYEQLIEQAPGVAELSNLGLVQMLGGNLDDALRSFEQAVEMAPENPFLLLNLADATFLRGDKEGARTKYRRVQELAVGDPSEPGWQLLSTRAQALAHLGEAEPAAEAIQQALRLAPESPQAAYEAALVYCLIGETTSARVNARRALEGFGPRWFRLPWFEPLHDLPELQLRAAA